MKQLFPVGSKSNRADVHFVEGIGPDQRSARSSAIQLVRAQNHVADPVVLPEHEAAVRLWRNFRATYWPQTPKSINGSSPMCFERRFYLD